ncbi:MAG: PAS domain-containing protein [Planctomycetota bacterium]|jgi:two-component system sensor histidine kinase HydH|nr:PAS domain-containing protein [Planctomycetota bacterium]
MNLSAGKGLSRPHSLFGLSPWLIVGVSVVLGLVIVYLANRDAAREKEHMANNLIGRANTIIWALEAGTRTWIGNRGEKDLLQPLMEETAKQPGIVYVAVVDAEGIVLAHSDSGKPGTLLSRQAIMSLENTQKADWSTAYSPDAPTFEVQRAFAPLQDPRDTMMSVGHGHHHRRGGYREPARSDTPNGVERNNFILVGLDQRPFQEALARDFQNTVVSALVVAALGMGGFISMFWAHSYQRSRRLLMDAQVLNAEVISNLPLGLITSDARGAIEIVNSVAVAMFGKSNQAQVGASLSDIPCLEWSTIISELDGGTKVLDRETELAMPGGKSLPIRLSASQLRDAEGTLRGHIFILCDIGEVKFLQAEVQRNEKLTALGNLAAGVAHEIRNPLSTIKGIATYIARKLPKGGREEESAKMLITEVNRLNTVVSELLEFARPNVVKTEWADVNEMIRHALRLANADMAGKNIRVDFTPNMSASRLRLNQERFTQVLLNLFLNAVQAMSPGGTLRIITHEEGDDFMLTIEDDGIGMSKEVMASIFNPYFTTKASGTGLGLAVAHQIVEGHGGRISVRSTPGSGSAFTIHLSSYGHA